MEEQVIRHLYEPPREETRVKLIKNSKSYGWEVTVARQNREDALAELKATDEELRKTYGYGPGKEE